MIRELRSFLLFGLAPRWAQRLTFVKLCGQSGQVVYMLGTLHAKHLRSRTFSLRHIQAVIENLMPDVLLVEIRQSELAAGNIGEGPVEMVFSNLIAQRNGIKVAGIDWWSVSMGPPNSSPKVRDIQMVKNIIDAVAENSLALVLVGYSHVPDFVDHLCARGFAKISFSEREKATLLAPSLRCFKFPKGMGAAIRKATDRLVRRRREGENSAWTAAFEDLIRSREAVLAQINSIGEEDCTPATARKHPS
jgi:hypothetical protein